MTDMTRALTPQEVDEIEGRCKAARDELARVCADNFKMRVHIPVQPDDSDEVISAGLDDVARLVADWRRMRELLDHADTVMETAVLHGLGDILPPGYRDGWASTHRAIKDALTPGKEGT